MDTYTTNGEIAHKKVLTLNVMPKKTLTLNIIRNNVVVTKKRIAKYTLAIFLERAKVIHGERYDYSEIKDSDINGKQSYVPILCNTCKHRWYPSIDNHINAKSRCPNCAGQTPWTLERFLLKAQEVHGEKYDYSQITKEHINGYKSSILIKCRKCDHQWTTTIDNHVNQENKCPNCSGRVPWTLERFVTKAQEIHESKYDYSQVTKDHINGHKSRIPIKCNKCKHEWSPSVGGHINGRKGCPDCAGNLPWTLEKFLYKAQEIYQNKYDYSQVTKECINGSQSYIPIKCNKCKYQWKITIGSHISNKSGCPDCYGNAPWTLERFLAKAQEIHGNKYDYSQIVNQDINGSRSHVPIRCNKCKHQWNPSIDGHINGKTGCPHCSMARGYSTAQITWMDNIMKEQNVSIRYALSPEGEYYISDIGKVDGFCAHTNTIYEFHGDYWHGNPYIYDGDAVNPTTGKTFCELYQKTLEKDQKIRDKGYNLIVMWESDFK